MSQGFTPSVLRHQHVSGLCARGHKVVKSFHFVVALASIRQLRSVHQMLSAGHCRGNGRGVCPGKMQRAFCGYTHMLTHTAVDRVVGFSTHELLWRAVCIPWSWGAKGSNPALLHCRQILYSLSHQGSPKRWSPCLFIRGVSDTMASSRARVYPFISNESLVSLCLRRGFM